MDRISSLKNAQSYGGVLFLQGVFKKDCKKMEDMFHDRLMFDNTINKDTKVYDKIPVSFTSLDDWLKSTNITCWYCHRTFKNRPWFEPLSIEPVSESVSSTMPLVMDANHSDKNAKSKAAGRKKGIKTKTPDKGVGKVDDKTVVVANRLLNVPVTLPDIKKQENRRGVCVGVNGLMCSCNCVAAYINAFTRDLTERLNKMAMLKYIYTVFTGRSIPDIQPSPPPTEMVQYGGALSAAEYQQKIDMLDSAYIKELEDNNFASICQAYIKTLTE